MYGNPPVEDHRLPCIFHKSKRLAALPDCGGMSGIGIWRRIFAGALQGLLGNLHTPGYQQDDILVARRQGAENRLHIL